MNISPPLNAKGRARKRSAHLDRFIRLIRRSAAWPRYTKSQFPGNA
jgi:hypothetical protein